MQERGGFPFVGGRIIAARGRGGWHRLPLELLPVLAEVDLESDDAILAFVQTYGVLGAWRDAFAVMSPFRTSGTGPTFVVLTSGSSGSGLTLPFVVDTPGGVDVGRLVRARQKHAALGSDPNGEFLDEFRIAAGGLLGLLAIQRELEAPRFSGTRLARNWPRYCPWPLHDTKDWAWRVLFHFVNAALASSSLSLAWVRNGETATGDERDFRPGLPVAAVVSEPATLYAVCGLELADHILAGDPWRVCANETCGRLFSVQEGRSRYGTHRTDNLKFHSPACKDAQAAREYRRREAAK